MRVITLVLRTSVVFSSLFLVAGYISHRSGLLSQLFARDLLSTSSKSELRNLDKGLSDPPEPERSTEGSMSLVRDDVVMSGSKSRAIELVADDSIFAILNIDSAARRVRGISFSEPLPSDLPEGENRDMARGREEKPEFNQPVVMSGTKIGVMSWDWRVVSWDWRGLSASDFDVLTNGSQSQRKEQPAPVVDSAIVEIASPTVGSIPDKTEESIASHRKVVMGGSKSVVVELAPIDTASSNSTPTALSGYSFANVVNSSDGSSSLSIEPLIEHTENVQIDSAFFLRFQQECEHLATLRFGSMNSWDYFCECNKPDPVWEAVFHRHRRQVNNHRSAKLSTGTDNNQASANWISEELTERPESALAPMFDTSGFPDEPPKVRSTPGDPIDADSI